MCGQPAPRHPSVSYRSATKAKENSLAKELWPPIGTATEQTPHITSTQIPFKKLQEGLPWRSDGLPVQGTWVQSLVWDDPTCVRATGPEPVQATTEPEWPNCWSLWAWSLCSKTREVTEMRSPWTANWEQTPLNATRESRCAGTKTQQSHKSVSKYKLKKKRNRMSLVWKSDSLLYQEVANLAQQPHLPLPGWPFPTTGFWPGLAFAGPLTLYHTKPGMQKPTGLQSQTQLSDWTTTTKPRSSPHPPLHILPLHLHPSTLWGNT